MKEYIDLSIKLTKDIPVFPGEPVIRFKKHASIGKNGYNEHQVTINAHFGTHIDFPYHMIEDGEKSDSFEISRFIGKGTVIDVNNLKVNDIDGDVILVYTGHLDSGVEHMFEDIPYLDEKLVDLIIEKNPKMVLLDIPTPDKYPFKIHKKLLNNHILIVENVVNMKQLMGKNFNVFVAPLNFVGFDGAPCRVFAEVES